MSTNIEIFQLTKEQLHHAINESLKTQLEDLKKHLQPKEPKEYLTRSEVAKMLKIDLSTVHNWNKKGILISWQIGGRVYYKRSQVEDAIIELKR